MRFWQAVVVAQMAAGAVWADRYHDQIWVHILADTGNVVIGWFLWRGLHWVFGDPAEVRHGQPS